MRSCLNGEGGGGGGGQSTYSYIPKLGGGGGGAVGTNSSLTCIVGRSPTFAYWREGRATPNYMHVSRSLSSGRVGGGGGGGKSCQGAMGGDHCQNSHPLFNYQGGGGVSEVGGS